MWLRIAGSFNADGRVLPTLEACDLHGSWRLMHVAAAEVLNSYEWW